MKYEVERLNLGNAMNIDTGIFTVPKTGIYHFTFSFVKHAYASGTHVSLQPNREHVGNAHATFQRDDQCTSSLQATLQLKVGDKIKLILVAGPLHDDPNFHHMHFTGSLLQAIP